MSCVVASRRADARARLDIESDFVVADGNVRFRQSFETVKDSETFSIAPAEVVAAARRLLAIDVARELSAIIHDTIVVEIGSSRVHFFGLRQFRGSLRCVDLKSTHVQHRFQDISICISLHCAVPPPTELPTHHDFPHHSHSYIIKELPGLEIFDNVSKGLGKISEICSCCPTG